MGLTKFDVNNLIDFIYIKSDGGLLFIYQLEYKQAR